MKTGEGEWAAPESWGWLPTEDRGHQALADETGAVVLVATRPMTRDVMRLVEAAPEMRRALREIAAGLQLHLSQRGGPRSLERLRALAVETLFKFGEV